MPSCRISCLHLEICHSPRFFWILYLVLHRFSVVIKFSMKLLWTSVMSAPIFLYKYKWHVNHHQIQSLSLENLWRLVTRYCLFTWKNLDILVLQYADTYTCERQKLINDLLLVAVSLFAEDGIISTAI